MFGKKPKPDEMCKKWRNDLRREGRNIDRGIREIEMQENKIKNNVRARAKAGDTASARILAKELVASKKAKEQLYMSKAQLHSVELQLQTQLASIKMAGVMGKSAEVMQAMNSLVKLPQLQQTMMAMSREMQKAGLIDEMISETMSMGEENLDEEADEEIDKVFAELTMDIVGAAGVVPARNLQRQQAEVVADDGAEDIEKRLNALKN